MPIDDKTEMIQDFITYLIILYAAAYTLRGTVLMFLPERETVKGSSCQACSGCPARKECSLPGSFDRKRVKNP
jgi:hypothetical protein